MKQTKTTNEAQKTFEKEGKDLPLEKRIRAIELALGELRRYAKYANSVDSLQKMIEQALDSF